MPRYRKLHVKIVESLDVNDMPDDFTRLLWVLLPLGLCREGRGLDNTAWIKAKVFPLREDVTSRQILDAMDWFDQRGMIRRYCVDGRDYFHLPTWDKYQGNTSKEAESNYPPPPDQVQTSSRVSPELVESKSSTDADADAYSNTDQESGADAPSANADSQDGSQDAQNGDQGTPEQETPGTFQEWQALIKTPPQGSNRVAVLMLMHEHLYPGLDPPSYAYLGKVARDMGGAGRLADLLWQHSTRPPTGDVLAYLIKCEQARKARNNGNGRTSHEAEYIDEGDNPLGIEFPDGKPATAAA